MSTCGASSIGVRAFVPLLLASAEGGHVVNTASMGGLIGGPVTDPYAATKHAVVGLSKGLRAELKMRGAKVGVTVVCPGRVSTRILDRLNHRPGVAPDVPLPAELQAIADSMRATGTTGATPTEAGRMIRDAIKLDRFWVFPGAEAHRPLLERDLAELLGAFPRVAPVVPVDPPAPAGGPL